MSRLRLRWKLVLAVLVVGSLTASGSAWAQTDGWSFVVTPQLWLTHIEKNGFAGPISTLGGGVIVNSTGQIVDANPNAGVNSKPIDSIYPQWGVQIAAQKGRLTLAGAFQRVDFETRTDIVSAFPGTYLPFFCQVFQCTSKDLIRQGQLLGRERLTSERMDVDLAVSYSFPDIVPKALDLSVGLGVKAIYAEATRRLEDLDVSVSFQSFLFGGAYLECSKDDLSNCRNKQTVHTTDWLYGLTIPTNMTVHLGDKWLLPVSISPFVGAETRDDHNIVYRFKQTGPTTVRVDRLDGTTLAVGVTADVTLRYLVTDALSFYAGGRAQFIKGHEQFLAFGPIVGMSVRFGGP